MKKLLSINRLVFYPALLLIFLFLASCSLFRSSITVTNSFSNLEITAVYIESNQRPPVWTVNKLSEPIGPGNNAVFSVTPNKYYDIKAVMEDGTIGYRELGVYMDSDLAVHVSEATIYTDSGTTEETDI